MNKKKILITAILALSAQVNAGTMGPVTYSRFVPFVSGEAVATWNNIKASTVFNNPPSITNDRWGGRAAAGVTNQYSERWGFSGELGWGYYGQTKSSQHGSSPDGRVTVSGQTTSQIYGFDVLAGVFYKINQCDLFFKAGAMAENRYYTGELTTTLITNGVAGSTNLSLSNTQTNVYPEIKVGAIYNVNNNLGISVAYMGVFGNNSLNSKSSGTLPNGTTTSNLNVSAALQNPTLNSVIFGLVYNFA